MAKINEYKPGMIVYGKVSGIKPYGAFVSFDEDVQGLIHISEISNKYVKNINKFFQLNSYVMVKVIDIDYQNKQLRLSYKALNQKRKRMMVGKNNDTVNKIGFSSLQKQLPIWINEYFKERNKI